MISNFLNFLIDDHLVDHVGEKGHTQNLLPDDLKVLKQETVLLLNPVHVMLLLHQLQLLVVGKCNFVHFFYLVQPLPKIISYNADLLLDALLLLRRCSRALIGASRHYIFFHLIEFASLNCGLLHGYIFCLIQHLVRAVLSEILVR